MSNLLGRPSLGERTIETFYISKGTGTRKGRNLTSDTNPHISKEYSVPSRGTDGTSHPSQGGIIVSDIPLLS